MCFSVKETNNVAVEGAAATLPAGAVQCPIEHPFSKFTPNTETVEFCCKCQSQTKCIAAGGATHYNIGGANAMMANDDVVDKSKFLIIQPDCLCPRYLSISDINFHFSWPYVW